MNTASHNKWSMRATAKYFGVSLGLVSENLMLAENIDKHNLKQFDYRKDALEFIKVLGSNK